MKTSIILTTYKRSQYLNAVLLSIGEQDLRGLDYEIIVVNDGPEDDTKDVIACSSKRKKLNVRYIHSGDREDVWRTMGFAANIGIQQAQGEVIVLSNSDMFHVGDVVRPVVKACVDDPKALSTVGAVYDDDGRLIQHFVRQFSGKSSIPNELDTRHAYIDSIQHGPRPADTYPTNPDMPFFMAIRRESLFEIGGYDEDFIGCASEDCDLLDRLLASGHHYVYGSKENCLLIHLHHGRRTISQLKADPGFAYNVKLREDRKGQLYRNLGRKWGEWHDKS